MTLVVSDCDVCDELETDDTFLCQISSETRDRVITGLRASAIGLH